MGTCIPELHDDSFSNPWYYGRTTFCVFNTLTEPTIDLRHAKKTAEEFRNDKTLPGVWPERLLHVESMTSYKREHRATGVFYNGVKEPQFSIVSYKWGLHVVPEGPTLQVDGIDWETPAIDQNYFTTSEQLIMLRKIGRHSGGWVWVDVGCITQLLMEETLREIIIEPQYFKQASQRYVWWLDFPTEVLQRLLSKINKAAIACSQALAAPTDDVDMHTLPGIAAEVLDPLTELISIPWFSSNWTLREIVLCPEILILGREGNCFSVDDGSGKQKFATIDMIAQLCLDILAWLQRVYARVMAKELVKFDLDARSVVDRIRDYAQIASAGSDIPSIELSHRVVLPTVESSEPIVKGLADSAGSLTLGTLVTCYIKSVETHGPFFLYASAPGTLDYWTRAVLETGVLVDRGIAGLGIHANHDSSILDDDLGDLDDGSMLCRGRYYHGWGSGYRIDCECSQVCGCTVYWEHNPSRCEEFCRNRGSAFSNYIQQDDFAADGSLLIKYGYHQNIPTHSPQKICIPCLLGISFRVRPDYVVTPHTAICYPRTEFMASTGVQLSEFSASNFEDHQKWAKPSDKLVPRLRHIG